MKLQQIRKHFFIYCLVSMVLPSHADRLCFLELQQLQYHMEQLLQLLSGGADFPHSVPHSSTALKATKSVLISNKREQ